MESHINCTVFIRALVHPIAILLKEVLLLIVRQAVDVDILELVVIITFSHFIFESFF
jgi:hypothetical protein